MTALSLLLALAVIGHEATAYTWPNPRMEALDGLRYEQDGVAGQKTAGPAVTCTTEGFITQDPNAGRINAGDWLRTAYHDMAPHDAATGIGGLDASIQFGAEQSRPENPGDGFNNTVGFVRIFAGPYVSLADAIALGAVLAVESCGGDYIPFRGGRIDATQAGPTGVPKPEDPLKQHTADFVRMGFSSKEMIQLVACGHSLGGVQHEFFPTIVVDPGTDDNKSGNQGFDTTFTVFDNKIATDYVSGKSVNPLVISPNVTMISDARIFGADGNVTMKGLAASNAFFKKTCSALFSRMLDTVPRGVKLTEEVLPLPAKPQGLVLLRNLNGTYTVSTSVRLWNMREDPSRAVKFVWAGSNGKPRGSYAMTHDPENDFSSFTPGNITSLFYNLPGSSGNVALRADTPASVLMAGDTTKLWFEVTERGRKQVLNQNGPGFPLGDTSVLLAEGSCLLVVIQDDSATLSLSLQIGVTKGMKPSSVNVKFLAETFSGDSSDTVVPAVFNRTASVQNTHIDVWSLSVTDPTLVQTSPSFQVSAVINGKTVTSNSAGAKPFGLPLCPGSVTG